MSTRAAWVTVVVAFVAITVYTAHIQKFWVRGGSDGEEYFGEAEQIAAGQTITAEAPYSYRVALPWLVAKTFPADLVRGFYVYNIAASAAGSTLLFAWLLAFRVGPATALLTAVLYIANWIGPARFLFFYPEYVDPPFIAFSIGALLLIHGLRRRFSWGRALALTLVCFAGAFIRETMLFAAVAMLFANLTFRAQDDEKPRIPAVALILPLAATLAALVLIRQLPMQPKMTQPGLLSHAWYLFQVKPLFVIPLSFFLTFGPVIAIVAYDWRRMRDVFARHAYLFVYFAGCFLTSYVGGHENERYLIWGAPLVYLLIAMALERHERALLRNAWIFVALAVGQTLASHILFPIPDYSLAVGDWHSLTTFGEKAWGVLNRLLVIDDFAWNVWSYFGSRPFHVLLLAIYAAFSSVLVTYLWRVERAHPELRPR
jgi:hypothetical protein